MPIENERKYVLYCDRKVLEDIKNKAQRILQIEQLILQEGSGWVYRLRKSTPTNNTNSVYTATYKHSVNTNQIELHHEISEQDYLDLANQAKGTIYKIRHEIPYDHYLWEVDAFYETNEYLDSTLYFILAEVELDENEESPDSIPDFITPHLLYKVPIGAKGFSNKKLRNIEYARNIYKHLSGSNHNGEKI